MKRFEGKHIFILGYGGISSALADLFVREGADVTVTCREPREVSGIQFCDAAEWPALFKEKHFDYVLSTKGMLYDDAHQPEKTVMRFERDWFLSSLDVNLLPTIELVKALQPVADKTKPMCFMSFSARVGSISDNELGGWYSYRMSKAALNMFLKSVAREWRFAMPKAHVLAYHPGTVLTHLSKPFQDHVKPGQAFTPEEAAEHCASCLLDYTQFASGDFIDWQKKKIDY